MITYTINWDKSMVAHGGLLKTDKRREVASKSFYNDKCYTQNLRRCQLTVHVGPWVPYSTCLSSTWVQWWDIQETNQHYPRRARGTSLLVVKLAARPQWAASPASSQLAPSELPPPWACSSPTVSCLPMSSRLAHGELLRHWACSSPIASSMVTESSPRVCPCISSSAADSPCLVLLHTLSIMLVTLIVATLHHLPAGPRP